MIPQVFETEVASYPKWNGVRATFEHYAYLIEPPRIYAEELDVLLGLYMDNRGGVRGQDAIVLYGQTKRYAYRYVQRKRWYFDAETGDLLKTDYTPDVTSVFTRPYILSATVDGYLFGTTAYSDMRQYSRTDMSAIEGTKIEHAEWEVPGGDVFTHKPGRNTRVHKGASNSHVYVHDIDTRALRFAVRTPGQAKQIGDAGNQYAYIVFKGGHFCILDCETGRLELVSRDERLDAPAGYGSATLGVDYRRKRLLFTQITPDEEDGAGTTRVGAYYPTPIVTGLTPFIPTRSRRLGRAVPFVAQAYGDAGEPIGGLEAAITSTGGITPRTRQTMTNEQGELRVTATMDAAGDASMTAEVQTNGND